MVIVVEVWISGNVVARFHKLSGESKQLQEIYLTFVQLDVWLLSNETQVNIIGPQM